MQRERQARPGEGFAPPTFGLQIPCYGMSARIGASLANAEALIYDHLSIYKRIETGGATPLPTA